MAAPKGYVQYDETIQVPPGTGVEGFMSSLREVLKLPNVQDIHINRQGQIEYTFFLREGQQKDVLTVNFDVLMPMAVVRNAQVQEVLGRDASAAVAVLQMFRAAALEHLQPIAFIMGVSSPFWLWYEATTSLKAERRDELFGLPVHVDRTCPDEALLLCTSFAKSELADTHKTYKIDIPQVTP